MQSRWRIELFGWLRVEQEGQVITRFATQKTAALLARLVLWPRRAHAREELCELLWPEVEPEAARARLRQALTSLRHQLEPPGVAAGSVLVTDRTQVRINPEAIVTDVGQFEGAIRLGQLEEAVSLYKGELLPGFYDEWVLAERERLQARFEELTQAQRAQVQTLPLAPSAPLPTAAPPLVRLPLQFTRFFGRIEERTQLAALLADYRLVTLTGPGGAGKTRLAIEAAQEQGRARQVLSVGLADLEDGTRLAEALAEGLRLPRDDSRSPLERVIAALAPTPTLLLLDNLEQVVEHAAPLVQTLLRQVPDLRLLATSRRRLLIAGEREFPVPALPLPETGTTVEALAQLACVQLFVDRAQLVRPDFQLTPRNAGDITRLCQQLEGSPLALELAAARASTLTPAQMCTRLEQRFELLATRRMDKDTRHRSLWAAIAWSVDLLPAVLQQCWRQLAVFRGGFTVAAVAAVTQTEAPLEALTQLRERSLISVEESGEEMRFRVAESLRAFAQEQLRPEETLACEQRHGQYFLTLAQESEAALRGAEQTSWLERLTLELENVRAALTRGIERGDTILSLDLVGSLWGFWERRGLLKEARFWLERALALPDPGAVALRARAFNRLGAVLNALCDFTSAEAIHRETLALYTALDDRKGIALVWNRLGFVAGQQGKVEEALHAFQESLAQERVLGNHFNMAVALANLGVLAQGRGDYAQAKAYLLEGRELFLVLENPGGIADCVLNLGGLAMEQAHWEEAQEWLDEAAARYHALDDRWSGAYVTYTQGALHRHRGQLEAARKCFEEVREVCEEIGDEAKVAEAYLQLARMDLAEGEPARARQRALLARAGFVAVGNEKQRAACETFLASLP